MELTEREFIAVEIRCRLDSGSGEFVGTDPECSECL